MQVCGIIYYSIVSWLLYMFRAILSLIIGSILTVITASDFIYMCCCRLLSSLSRNWHKSVPTQRRQHLKFYTFPTLVCSCRPKHFKIYTVYWRKGNKTDFFSDRICILRWISFVTSQASHPYKSTDFTQALNILILETACINAWKTHHIRLHVQYSSYKMTNEMQLCRIIDNSIVPWLLYMFRAILSLIIRSI
jgi:hypothetical protein